MWVCVCVAPSVSKPHSQEAMVNNNYRILIETCSKTFLAVNAISRPYACTLRKPYATTMGACAGDYGQHNLPHCLRDPVSCGKMTLTAHNTYGARQNPDVFLSSGFLFESTTQGFHYLIASTRYQQVAQISQASLFGYGSSTPARAYAQLTHGLRMPHAKNTTRIHQCRKD